MLLRYNIIMFLNYPVCYSNQDEYVLFFVSDESIWKLTAKSLDHVLKQEYNLNRFLQLNCNIKNICLSQDKKWIVFTCMLDGLYDIYTISVNGGELHRITSLNSSYIDVTQVIDDKIMFASTHESHNILIDKIFIIKFDLENGCRKNDANVEYTGCLADWYVTDGSIEVVQQHGYAYAKWRKYQGGRNGKLWMKNPLENKHSPQYKKLLDNGYNAVRPYISNGYVYFLTDVYGIGNVCRIDLSNDAIKVEQCTFETEHYVEHFYVDVDKILYTAGGDLFVLQIGDSNKKQIIVKDKIFKAHLYTRHIKDHGEYKSKMLDCMSGCHIRNDSKRILIVVRGKIFEMPTYTSIGWSIGETDKYYGDAIYVNEKILLTEIGQKETLVMLDTEENNRTVCLRVEYDFGHIIEVKVANNGEYAAVRNNRAELLLVTLKTGEVKKLIEAEYCYGRDFSWSAQGRYLAYTDRIAKQTSLSVRAIFIYDTKLEKVMQITDGLYDDFDPVFDANGKYLYFLSNRNIKTENDTMRLMLHFENTASPFIVTLQADVIDPFLNIEDVEQKEEKEDQISKEDKNVEENAEVEKSTAENTIEGSIQEDKKQEQKDIKEKEESDIDFENIMNRCYVIPNAHDDYIGLAFFNKELLLYELTDTPDCINVVKYNFGLQKCVEYLQNVNTMILSANQEHFLYIQEHVLKVGEAGEATWKKGGVIDWSRINLQIEPTQEFRAIFAQAWFLMKETFAEYNRKKINWNELYDKYIVLVDKVSTRDELNHVILLMQGELESSHSYLMQTGDIKKRVMQNQGYLGADVEYDVMNHGYRIVSILKGRTWSVNELEKSPLYDCKIGDIITHINGIKLEINVRPEYVLRNTAGKTVQIKIKSMEINDKQESVSKSLIKYVKVLPNEIPLRYTDWVQGNKQIVAAKNEEIGYIHIPAMDNNGYEIFVKEYMSQYSKKGLIIDARGNMGGYVAAMILDILTRRRVGVMCSKFGAVADPYETCSGKLVFLIDSGTSSDGDEFAYTVKKLNLGKTVGIRTWGGVIGIMPRFTLLDNGKFSIPEFPTYLLQAKDPNTKKTPDIMHTNCKCDSSKLECCMKCYQSFNNRDDVRQVENYGVMPDVIVEHTPDQKDDVQLLTAIESMLSEI